MNETTHDEIEFTRRLSQAYSGLVEDSRYWANEEEIRLALVAALNRATGLRLKAERGKEDLSYNNVVIECKGPGLFKGTKSSTKFIEARDERILKYVKRRAAKENRPQEDYIGVMFDGEHFCFATVKDDVITTEHLLESSEYSLMLVVQALKADLRRPVTADALIEDFGHKSEIARDLMQGLSDALAEGLGATGGGKIPMLFKEWRTLYGQVADLSTFQTIELNRNIAFEWKGRSDVELSAGIFVIHTYNSILVKLLAAEIVSSYGLTSQKQPAQYMASIPNDKDLIRFLKEEIEHSGIFFEAGITGFVEEVIFSWYLDVLEQDTPISHRLLFSLREALATLSLYQAGDLSGTKDVLRDVYQGLVPAVLRKSLGEFYTPDWLVDFTIDSLEPATWIDRRVLDPTCGSGSFLLGVIARKRADSEAAGRTAAGTLTDILSNCWGIDLNPLAVQISRVNYLMAVADLLAEARLPEVEVPILMADAIYSPAPSPEGGDRVVHYSIGSSVAALDVAIPTDLAFDRVRLDEVLQLMGKQVEDDVEYPAVDTLLRSTRILSDDEADEFYSALQYSYNQVLALHRKNWNGIWFRIVRNFFWSATAGKFDTVVGNPPWVRWSRLPEAYRDRVKPTCDAYGIFSENKRHGGNELDVSAIVTYAVADKWLKNDGNMALVLTGALFKNASSSGFRNFILHPDDEDSSRINPTKVHDFKTVKPFPGVANHTVVVAFDKSHDDTRYPVPYTVWSKARSRQPSLGVNDQLADALAQLTMDVQEAFPVREDEPGSAWSVMGKGQHKRLAKLIGSTEWATGRKGITADLNGVYFVRIFDSKPGLVEIESRPEAGKKNIGPVKRAWVENEMIYPLVKGASDFDACYVKIDDPNYTGEHLFTFVPNKTIAPKDYASLEADMASPRLQRTSKWFAGYKELLLNRSTYRRHMPDAPYYSVYNVGDYTLKPWKVIFPEMGKVKAAVVGSREVPGYGLRPVVPDHKIYFAAFDSPDEAMFLCGLINNPSVVEVLTSYLVDIQMGNILKNLALPEYDASNSEHQELVAQVNAAHAEHDAKARRSILEKINMVSTKILGI